MQTTKKTPKCVKLKIKFKFVNHKFSGSLLYAGKWVNNLPNDKDIDLSLIGKFEDIEQGGKYSNGIIDTNYLSPQDFDPDKNEWDDEDDTTDDYEEVEREIKTDMYWVEYHNFHPDYKRYGASGHETDYIGFKSKKKAIEWMYDNDNEFVFKALNF